MPNEAGGLRHKDKFSSDLARSASYNHIPTLDSDHHNTVDVKRTFSEVNLPQSAESQKLPDRDGFTTGKEILRQSSFRSSKGKVRTQGAEFALPTDASTETVSQDSDGIESSNTAERPQQSRFMSEAFANLTRKKWRSSRSPSPPQPGGAKPRPGNVSSGKRGQLGGSDAETGPQNESLPKRARKPLGNFGAKNKADSSATLSKNPSIQSLRGRASLDRFVAAVSVSDKGVPPVPQAVKNPIQSSKASEVPRKKDELWSVFRGLDADYQKFQSKSSAFKANVVRLTLIPCLARYSRHPSTKSLRPEDLDRRVNILNKWWTGLLEMLSGKSSHSITGTDRPVYLEALVAIMTMPEWRIPTFGHLLPATPPIAQKPAITTRTNTSFESTGSDFLVESIHHNIRNIFSQNLLSQMAYCIDKMSIRHTPASVVAFCGKTCAYAFFFCPHVADILVRLWGLTPDVLRSVASGFNLDPSSTTRASVSEDIASNFPTPVRSLSFLSHTNLARYLRSRTIGPLAASHINWFGPWTSRWNGLDTDLFFVFVKHFHILIADFLPRDTKTSSFVYVPGLVPVHAQVLTVLENTINKQSTPQSQNAMHGPTSATFDDFIDGTDAAATALPLGTANKFRTMSENRLVMMLRDFLRDSSIHSSTKQNLAGSLCGILKLAARRTSLFNHSGCFTLCDFVEELASIVSPYCRSIDLPDLLDWDFWLEVCRQMMVSNNSLTEVRAFAFLFASWNAINALDKRKEHLCLELLLEERLFYRYFSHWSPMVRSYFHRLLCWRMARFDGRASELDRRIYSTLADRLSKVWDFFTSFQEKAEKLLAPPLSTAPCPPAPGRRLIIIRNDYDYPPHDMFLSLSDGAPSSLTGASSSHDQQDPNGVEEDNQSASQPRLGRGWRMLKTMFSNPSNPKPGEVTPPGSGSEDKEDFDGVDNSKNTKASSDVQAQPSASETQATSESAPEGTRRHLQRRSSFRFTLEWADRSRRMTKDRHLYPPSLPRSTQGYIQTLRTQAISQSDSTSVSNSLSGTGSMNGSEMDSEEDNESRLPSDDSARAIRTQSKAAEAAETKGQTGDHTELAASKYAGRALAEWALVISECDNFFQRRRGEGVSSDNMVEVPTLSVETFRK